MERDPNVAWLVSDPDWAEAAVSGPVLITVFMEGACEAWSDDIALLDPILEAVRQQLASLSA